MSGQVLLMPDHFCVVSDRAKLKLVLTDIMSVQQQIVIICPAVEPLYYNGHFGTTNSLRYTEVSVTQRVQRSRAYLMS